MKKTPIYKDGEYQGHFECTGKRKKQTLKERIDRAKRAKRDARLVQILTK